jgi:ABC-type microcin C transport system permease subunit YejE
LTYTDLDFTGARLVNLLWTLVVLLIAVAIGALLGWLGGKVSPSPTA